MNWDTYIKGFKTYLQFEKSLSSNSIEAYINDVQKFIQYLNSLNLKLSPLNIDLKHLQNFIKWINELGMSACTQARMISGIKAFYKYLLLENLISKNPTELLESPKIGRKLPDTLNVYEIDQIIGAIDLSKPEGERNKAILETLYGCGLRVSELINLKISNLFFNDNFIKIVGKGNKERLVPIGSIAVKQINIYIRQVRIHINIKKGNEDIVFLNRRGSKLSRNMIFIIVKNLAEKIGLKKNCFKLQLNKKIELSVSGTLLTPGSIW
jgi:integrase/recombinase XerD